MRKSAPIPFAALLILVLTIAAYSNTFRAPYVFDDQPTIVDNPTIRGFGQFAHWWLPPPSSTATSRPLLNASFAINYCISGYDVWSYHLVNLAIHLACGLLVYRIVRASLPPSPSKTALSADGVALIAAGLWLLHPLQTESVSYLTQRAESLVSLYYLAALDLFIVGTKGKPWALATSVAVLIAGVFAKEIIVTAPAVIFLYDLAFVGGSAGAALRARGRYYLCAATCWPLTVMVLFFSSGRSGAVSFAGATIGPWAYLQTEAYALGRYFFLSFVPVGQIFPYAARSVTAPAVVIPCGLLILALLALTVGLLIKRPKVGFLLAAVFLILSPTSSFVPIVTEPIAEHRMYLPLACLCAGVAVLISRLGRSTALGLSGLLMVALAATTYARNRVFQSPVSVWADASAKQPDDADTVNNYGSALAKAGRDAEAEAAFRRSLALNPSDIPALFNLGNQLKARGALAEAIGDYALAVRRDPRSTVALLALGVALRDADHVPDAEGAFRHALEVNPNLAAARNGLGTVQLLEGHPEQAQLEFEAAARLDPAYPDPVFNQGNLRLAQNAPLEAKADYEKALALKPDFPEAAMGLAEAEAALGETNAAIADYKNALRLRPGFAEADYNLGSLYLSLRRNADAEAVLDAAIAARPDFPEAELNLAALLLSEGHAAASIPHFRHAVALQPSNPDAHHNLSLALRAVGDADGARREAALAGER